MTLNLGCLLWAQHEAGLSAILPLATHSCLSLRAWITRIVKLCHLQIVFFGKRHLQGERHLWWSTALDKPCGEQLDLPSKMTEQKALASFPWLQ